MKIVHWAIIFVMLILPFSIICRSTIQKKTLVLQDQTRINNILDNATFDAVEQIIEVSTELGYGKNIPITQSVANALINRFFQSLAVNFNLPSTVNIAKDYFGKYIPVMLIIGYDGLYVYSYDLTDEGYMYVLKPKIPYSYTDEKGVTINFTLGNDVKLYISDTALENENLVVSGKLVDEAEVDLNELGKIKERIDNYPATIYDNKKDYIEKVVPGITSNLTIILKILSDSTYYGAPIDLPTYLMTPKVTQDYEYDGNNKVIVDASDFHKLRRDTIINLITSVLQEEVNEHNTYADLIGVNYNFYLPTIAKEQWQNTIDDISVLAFFQGMPIGTDSYYNNYSLGGARIVQKHDFYGTSDKLYHKYNCPVIAGSDGKPDYDKYEVILINVKEANENGYYSCSLCR